MPGNNKIVDPLPPAKTLLTTPKFKILQNTLLQITTTRQASNLWQHKQPGSSKRYQRSSNLRNKTIQNKPGAEPAIYRPVTVLRSRC